MADLMNKKVESAIKKRNEDIGKLEKQLEAVYDSIARIDTVVVGAVQNFANLYKVIEEISNVDLLESKLNTSLDNMSQNINAFVVDLGLVKAALMDINGLEYNTNINVLVNNSFDATEFIDGAQNVIEGYERIWSESFNNIYMKMDEMLTLLNSVSGAYKSGDYSDKNEIETDSNKFGLEQIGEIFVETVIETFFESLIKKVGDKSTRETILKWAKKVIESDTVKGALLSMSNLVPSFDSILPTIAGKFSTVASYGIPFAIGAAGIYSGWRINEESIDLRAQIEELGEKEGRIAAGTDIWDKAAIMEYDINKSKDTMLQMHVDMFSSIGEQLRVLYEDWTEKMALHQDNVTSTNNAITEAHVGMFGSLGEGVSNLYESGVEKISLHRDNVQTTNENMTQAYMDLISIVGENSGTLYEDWKEKMELYQGDTTEANNAITESYVQTFNEIARKISNWWNQDIVPYFTEENWTFGGIATGLSKSIGDGIGAIVQSLNNISISINTTGMIGVAAHPNSISVYEMGGFPEDGLFMANHGELVGKFSNGKTAVANNEQIVSGIKLGVREAVSEVLAPYLADIAQNTRETANKDFTTYIGDKEIARASERGRRTMGLQLITEY